jgi:hypothetical protein
VIDGSDSTSMHESMIGSWKLDGLLTPTGRL